MAQQVKDLVLSLLWLGSLLWHGFEPLHGVGEAKRKKKKWLVLGTSGGQSPRSASLMDHLMMER